MAGGCWLGLARPWSERRRGAVAGGETICEVLFGPPALSDPPISEVLGVEMKIYDGLVYFLSLRFRTVLNPIRVAPLEAWNRLRAAP